MIWRKNIRRRGKQPQRVLLIFHCFKNWSTAGFLSSSGKISRRQKRKLAQPFMSALKDPQFGQGGKAEAEIDPIDRPRAETMVNDFTRACLAFEKKNQ